MPNERTDLMQGTLELLILNTLARESMHGYGIVQRIHEAAEDLLKVEDGSLYPALHRMTEERWLKAEWGVTDTNRKARFYSITAAGKKQLAAEEKNWAHLTDAVARFLRFA